MKALYTLLILLVPFIVSGQCNRLETVNNFNSIYLNTGVSTDELSWTGNIETCQSGGVSLISLQKTLERINYFRGLVGLPENIILNNELNEKCQEAALMMHANSSLNHYPPIEWSCYSEDGYDAASHSNLAMGTHSSSSITAYIRDNGSGNYAVGHRRWILYSRANEFGTGSTSNYNALYVIASTVNAPENLSFISYPSPGFFPSQLVFDRWSFSIPNADFSNANIEMQKENGTQIDLSLEELANGYGDNTIVWLPNFDIASVGDQKIKVIISNISNSPQNEYEYDVILMNDVNGNELIHPPICPENYVWNDILCMCDNGTSTNESLSLKVRKKIKIVNVFGQETQIEKNSPVFYIYDDGSVEKKLIIE